MGTYITGVYMKALQDFLAGLRQLLYGIKNLYLILDTQMVQE